MRTVTRRRQPRFSLPPSHQATVTFQHPESPGEHFELPLVDISVSGVSFTIDRARRSVLEAGATLPQTTLRIGDCHVRGELVVMHVTPESDSPCTCGALFYPEQDSDLVKLKSLIAGMQAASGARASR